MSKCPNEFLCEICKGIFCRDRPHEESIREHEYRCMTIPDYDDGESPVEVCDDCYKKAMKHMGHL